MSVKRWYAERMVDGRLLLKHVVLASDYDALCEVVQELVDCLECTCYRIRGQCEQCKVQAKALALIGESVENGRGLFANWI